MAFSNHHGINGKELLLATLRHESVPQVPWVPFAGVHAGKLRGYSAIEILKDGDKLLESLLAVNQVYDPDGQPVIFDLQVEAEILGCDLVWAENGPPTVASHPLEARMEVPTKLPERGDGRLPMILDVMRKLKAKVGDKTALYGLVCGPMTLASHLRGTEIFTDSFDNPDFLNSLLAYTRDVTVLWPSFLAFSFSLLLLIPISSLVSPCRKRITGWLACC